MKDALESIFDRHDVRPEHRDRLRAELTCGRRHGPVATCFASAHGSPDRELFAPTWWLHLPLVGVEADTVTREAFGSTGYSGNAADRAIDVLTRVRYSRGAADAFATREAMARHFERQVLAELGHGAEGKAA